MKKNLWSKIIILLIIIFFVLPSYPVAQELSKLENNISLQQPTKASNLGEVVVGEKLYSCDPGFVENMDNCIVRDLLQRSNLGNGLKEGNRQHGIWIVPSIEATYYPYSGKHYVINKWGDTKMGISFPIKVDILGAWFVGQGGGEGVWAKSIRVIGYLNGEYSQTTGWFEDIDDTPTWFAINLKDVDRIVIESTPVYNGAGWYAMDDLTYTPKMKNEQEQTIVIDFEDCNFNQNLDNSNYAGLKWETGTGNVYIGQNEISPPQREIFLPDYSSQSRENSLATEPILLSDFQGVIRGDAGSWSYPPDSCGAVGPNHFVEVVNRNFAVFNKSTGEELINILLGSFLPGSNGDPRVLFDQYSNRWFIIVCDFNTKIYLAVSTSDDPTGNWFKCNFTVSQGSDAGKWPDYPTLGVDEDGIYTAAYMVGGSSGMSIFALEKAPLIAPSPYVGDIWAFRELPWEGAIQPVHTFETSDGEYFVSRASSTSIRVRLLTNLLSTPVLNEIGFVTVPSNSEPPDAPALGSTIPLDTVDSRLMNAVYRDDYIWTAHCIDVDGRAASRWYKIDAENITLNDYGTIQDPVMYYFFPTIMVNDAGDAIMGFSGSCSVQYAAAYYTGRLASDPPGKMAPPILFKSGEDIYNLIDSYGRNRWGDYSLCSLDPVKQTLWTIQEYAHSHNASDINRWGTWICELNFNQPPETPTKPDGPEEWLQNVEATFSTSAIEPEGEDVYYMFDWGDGNYSEWVGPYHSGETGEASHIWYEFGDFEVKAIAKDINGVQSGWSEAALLTIVEEQAPARPQITGKQLIIGGLNYDYIFVSTDPESHDIYYKVDWDDGNVTDWFGPYSSGESIKLGHKWHEKGTYTIKAWAKDVYGKLSTQSNYMIIVLFVVKSNPSNNQLFNIILHILQHKLISS